MTTKNAGPKKLVRVKRKSLLHESKVSKKIMIAPRGGVWGEDWSLIEERKGKCVVSFPTWYYAQGNIDGDLGLIAVIMLKGIYCTSINTKNPVEVIYEFKKRYTKKIQAIEKAFFAHEIQIDAKDITEVTAFLVNYLLPSGAKYNFSGKGMDTPSN